MTDSPWGGKVHTLPANRKGGAGQASTNGQSTAPDGSAVTSMIGDGVGTSSKAWDFFSSPQFSVLAAAVAVLLAGAAMYNRLDDKLDALRADSKGQIERAQDKVEGSIDKLDVKFEKVDAKFQSVLDKIDADGRELRSLVREVGRDNKSGIQPRG